jgi:hypothetical protein
MIYPAVSETRTVRFVVYLDEQEQLRVLIDHPDMDAVELFEHNSNTRAYYAKYGYVFNPKSSEYERGE